MYSEDEAQIRALIETWMVATRAGDVEAVMGLMTDDVVFLMPGRPAMSRADFEAAARLQAGGAGPQVDGTSDIQEVQVAGEWAFARSQLSVTVTPPGGAAPPTVRSGPVLTVFRKERGRWLLARDANMLAVQAPPPT
ncbi:MULTISPECIES: YybH family protein [unclassified Acidovorax]|uniref:YybH family protein n=1 Tax=unclassified Acidovorax TaxID=2684926 RepID=UPI00070F37A0|nr:SgcJ/EcaC family oxidoreductase [Acidovorax sp. Root217]KRC20964.1 ketosteroid isomerase [Acidovorax sp. Root217]